MEQIRPFPPTELIDQAEEDEAIRLAPAADLKEWVETNFLTLGGALHNPDHDHIAELLHDDETFLAFAWASSAAVAKKRMVLGQCEKVMFNQGDGAKLGKSSKCATGLDLFLFISLRLMQAFVKVQMIVNSVL